MNIKQATAIAKAKGLKVSARTIDPTTNDEMLTVGALKLNHANGGDACWYIKGQEGHNFLGIQIEKAAALQD